MACNCNYMWYIFFIVVGWGLVFIFSTVNVLTTVIFQQIAHEPTKFWKEFAAYRGEMYPERLCLQILPDASLHVCRWFLVGPVSESLEAFGSFERNQAGWISQQTLRTGMHAKFTGGIAIMRTITATTAFKIPFYGISSPLSDLSVSSTVLQTIKKLHQSNLTAVKSSNELSRLFSLW